MKRLLSAVLVGVLLGVVLAVVSLCFNVPYWPLWGAVMVAFVLGQIDREMNR